MLRRREKGLLPILSTFPIIPTPPTIYISQKDPAPSLSFSTASPLVRRLLYFSLLGLGLGLGLGFAAFRNHKMRGDDQQSRLIYELCALLFTILRNPHLAVPSSPSSSPSPAATALPPPPTRRPRPPQVSAAGVASLMLGASLALMLCGSVTFVIGFILMPWVVGLLMVFYFVGIVSNLSGMGRAILCPNSPSSSKEV